MEHNYVVSQQFYLVWKSGIQTDAAGYPWVRVQKRGYLARVVLITNDHLFIQLYVLQLLLGKILFERIGVHLVGLAI